MPTRAFVVLDMDAAQPTRALHRAALENFVNFFLRIIAAIF